VVDSSISIDYDKALGSSLTILYPVRSLVGQNRQVEVGPVTSDRLKKLGLQSHRLTASPIKHPKKFY